MSSIRDRAIQLLGVEGEMPEMSGSLKEKTLSLLDLDDEQRNKQLLEALNAAVLQVGQQLSQQMAQNAVSVQASIRELQQAVAELKKPKTVQLSDIQTDKGVITGAKVTSA